MMKLGNLVQALAESYHPEQSHTCTCKRRAHHGALALKWERLTGHASSGRTRRCLCCTRRVFMRYAEVPPCPQISTIQGAVVANKQVRETFHVAFADAQLLLSPQTSQCMKSRYEVFTQMWISFDMCWLLICCKNRHKEKVGHEFLNWYNLQL